MTTSIPRPDSSPLLTLSLRVPKEQVLSFADHLKQPILPERGLTRNVQQLKFCMDAAARKAYCLYYNVDELKQQMRRPETTVEDIVRLASPHAKVLPECAFLVLWYGEKTDETEALARLWLSRGYLLFTDVTTTVDIGRTSEMLPLLESFADLICFESTALGQNERVNKATDFLTVVISSLKSDNIVFTAQVIAEVLYALFPDGLSGDEEAFWNRLEDCVLLANRERGEYQGKLFADYLLIFVKWRLRNGDADLEEGMQAIRRHVLNANQPESTELLKYFFGKKIPRDSHISHELVAIEQAVTAIPLEKPLLEEIFSLLFASDPLNVVGVAERYMGQVPSIERNQLSMATYYFGSLGLPTNREGLFVSVYLSHDYQARYVVVFDAKKGEMAPALELDKDPEFEAPMSVFRLLEETLMHLRKTGYVGMADRLQKISMKSIQEWASETLYGAEALERLAKVCEVKLALSKEFTLPPEEIQALREILLRWLYECWKLKHGEKAGATYENYNLEGLLSLVPPTIQILNKAA